MTKPKDEVSLSDEDLNLVAPDSTYSRTAQWRARRDPTPRRVMAKLVSDLTAILEYYMHAPAGCNGGTD